MKNHKIKLFLLNLIPFFFACSVNEPVDIKDFNGDWKIFIGNEYSHQTKNINIEIQNEKILYDSVTFDSLQIKNRNIQAIKYFAKDSTFKLNLNITSEDKIWGYEIKEYSNQIDSIYIFGEKLEIK